MNIDIIGTLQQEKKWHLTQVQRIDDAMKTLPTRQNHFLTRHIRWRTEIERVFQELDNLKPHEVIDALVENGVFEANIMTRRPNVYSTLRRMVKEGYLEQLEDKRYKKTQK